MHSFIFFLLWLIVNPNGSLAKSSAHRGVKKEAPNPLLSQFMTSFSWVKCVGWLYVVTQSTLADLNATEQANALNKHNRYVHTNLFCSLFSGLV